MSLVGILILRFLEWSITQLMAFSARAVLPYLVHADYIALVLNLASAGF